MRAPARSSAGCCGAARSSSAPRRRRRRLCSRLLTAFGCGRSSAASPVFDPQPTTAARSGRSTPGWVGAGCAPPAATRTPSGCAPACSGRSTGSARPELYVVSRRPARAGPLAEPPQAWTVGARWALEHAGTGAAAGAIARAPQQLVDERGDLVERQLGRRVRSSIAARYAAPGSRSARPPRSAPARSRWSASARRGGAAARRSAAARSRPVATHGTSTQQSAGRLSISSPPALSVRDVAVERNGSPVSHARTMSAPYSWLRRRSPRAAARTCPTPRSGPRCAAGTRRAGCRSARRGPAGAALTNHGTYSAKCSEDSVTNAPKWRSSS